LLQWKGIFMFSIFSLHEFHFYIHSETHFNHHRCLIKGMIMAIVWDKGGDWTNGYFIRISYFKPKSLKVTILILYTNRYKCQAVSWFIDYIIF
jgi:hypothetical protein